MLPKTFRNLKCLILLFVCCAAIATKAQTTDSSKVKSYSFKKTWDQGKDLFSWKAPHSPKKATIYAAVLPGLGQIYNRKYWKTPIVWGALGGAVYYTFDNRNKMRAINDTLKSFYIKHMDTFAANPLHIAKRNQYRQQRDIGILAFTALYVLQIIDATVDAHFFRIDFNQKLSAKINPSPSQFFTFTWKLNGQNNTTSSISRRYTY